MRNPPHVDASDRCQKRPTVLGAGGGDSEPGGQVDHLNEAGDAQEGQQVLGPSDSGSFEEGVEEEGGKLIVGTPGIGCNIFFE